MLDSVISLYEDTVGRWLSEPLFIGVVAVFMASWMGVKMYPVILYLCKEKNLMDSPDEVRKVHINKVPNLGGVGLYVAFTLCITILGALLGFQEDTLNMLLLLVTGVTILFFLGVKDDLIGLSPYKKLAGQAVASLLLILALDLRISSMEGLFGIGGLPYLVSIAFTLFVFLLVINAYNLVDGIDGLAGAIAVIASASFGTLFLLNDNMALVMVSFTLIGAVRGFLRFNLSEDLKVFMGDSGSMFIGFVLAFQAVAFLSMYIPDNSPYAITNGPILSLAILSFPLLDTLRVFVIRVRQGRSPFSADKNHIHHRLLALGLSHKNASLLIAGLNLLIIGLALWIQNLNINLQLLILGMVAPAVCLLPCILELSKQGKIVLSIRKLV